MVYGGRHAGYEGERSIPPMTYFWILSLTCVEFTTMFLFFPSSPFEAVKML